jgi:tetratricopeptide (TPR) repeat protein
MTSLAVARSAPSTPLSVPLWWSLAGGLLVAALVYLPAALGARFLGFDDNFFFGPHNPEFQAGLAAVLDPARPIANAYLPVAHLSLYLDYVLAGTAPFLAHLHALVLHGVVGAALARLWLRLGAGPLVAHAAALLWVVHPASAESVAWVSGRKDLLSGLFVVLTLQQIQAHGERPSGWRLGLIALCSALAMYAKATAVVLPLLGAWLLWCGRRGWRGWSGVFGCGLVVAAAALHHASIAAAEGTLADGSVLARLQQVPGACWHYVHTALWPVRLNVLYPEVDTLAAFRAAWLPGTLVLLGGIGLGLVALRRPGGRLAAGGLVAFAIALLPFNTAFPASSIAAADRYLYLALPGLGLAVAATLAGWLGPRGGWLAVALALPLAFLAGRRAHDFADDETLWSASLAVCADNAVANYNLVLGRLQRGGVLGKELREPLQRAVAAARYPIHELRARQLLVRLCLLDADYEGAAAQARSAIAAAAAQLERETSPQRRREATALVAAAHIAAFEPLQLAGEFAAAAASHAAAQQLAPTAPEVVAFGALIELAQCAAELHRRAAAGEAARLADDDPRGAAADARLAASLEQHPNHAGLWLAQAEWHRARDRVLPALRCYRKAQAIDPDRIEGWRGAAQLLRERGQYDEAIGYCQQGLARRADPALRQELALAQVGRGQLDDAELHLRAYLKVRPDDRDTAKILANVLAVRAWSKLADGGDDREPARQLVEQALALNPDEPRIQLVLGRLARLESRFADAVRHLEIAQRRMPTIEEARTLHVESLAALGYQRLGQRDDDGAADAWLRCLANAAADFDRGEIENQLQLLWGRYEQRGIEALRAGDRAAAIASFRQCLRLWPDQHWAAWLLATAMQAEPDPDLAELERLCRLAVAWQQRHQNDAGQQVWLLAKTLLRRGDVAGSKAVAAEYLAAPPADAKPQVVAALQQLAGR